MKISAAVRAKLGNDNRPDAIRDALKAEIDRDHDVRRSRARRLAAMRRW